MQSTFFFKLFLRTIIRDINKYWKPKNYSSEFGIMRIKIFEKNIQ